MRAMPLAVVIMTVFLASAAHAERQSGPLGSSPGPAIEQMAGAVTPNPLAQDDVSKIIGTTVYDVTGKKVGDVATVLMNPQTKCLNRFVVRVIDDHKEGILGIGGRLVAVPIGAFWWNAEKPGLAVAVTAEALKSMAVWDEPSPENSSIAGVESNRIPPNGMRVSPSGCSHVRIQEVGRAFPFRGGGWCRP